MRETHVILKILMKRLFHRKAFLACLAAIPFLVFGMQELEKGSDTYIRAGVYMEKETAWNQKLCTLLTKTDGRIQFTPYHNLDEMQQDIVSERIECGYILQEDLQNDMLSNKWNNSVPVYQSAHSMLTPVVNEVFFKELFTLVSEDWFEGYVANQEEFSPVEKEKLREISKERLQKYLENGSTFFVEYHYLDTNSKNEGTETERSVFPVRGMTAVMILLCGLIGIFDCIADRERGPFPILGRKKTVFCLDLMLPVFSGAAIGLIVLFFTGIWKGMVEIPAMLGYSILVIIWCMLFRLLVRNQKQLAAVLPLILLCSMLLTPVFVDLSSLLPAFQVLEKLIPVTYYLRFF